MFLTGQQNQIPWLYFVALKEVREVLDHTLHWLKLWVFLMQEMEAMAMRFRN